MRAGLAAEETPVRRDLSARPAGYWTGFHLTDDGGGSLSRERRDAAICGSLNSTSLNPPFSHWKRRAVAISFLSGELDSKLHDLHTYMTHEPKFPFVSRIEFIRSKLSNFSAHVSGVSVMYDVISLCAVSDIATHCRFVWRRVRSWTTWPR